MTTSSKADNGGRSRPLEAAQHGLDPRQHLARGEGLGDVVVGAELKAQDAVIFSGARGEKNNGDGAQCGVMVPQPAADVEAVAAGNHDVEEKEHGRLALGVGDQICRSDIGADRKARCLQMMLNKS